MTPSHGENTSPLDATGGAYSALRTDEEEGAAASTAVDDRAREAAAEMGLDPSVFVSCDGGGGGGEGGGGGAASSLGDGSRSELKRKSILKGNFPPRDTSKEQDPPAAAARLLSPTKARRAAYRRRASLASPREFRTDTDGCGGDPVSDSDDDGDEAESDGAGSVDTAEPLQCNHRRESSEIKCRVMNEMVELERRDAEFRHEKHRSHCAEPPLTGTLRRQKRRSSQDLTARAEGRGRRGDRNRRASTGAIMYGTIPASGMSGARRSSSMKLTPECADEYQNDDETGGDPQDGPLLPWSRQAPTSHYWQKLAMRSSLPDTPPNELVRRGAFFLMSTLTCCCGWIWGLMYWFLDERIAAIFPAVYTVLMTGCLLVCTGQGRYSDIVTVQLLLILLLPISLQVCIGGMVKAGGVMLWSFLCPMGAALFLNRETATRWFALYLALSVLTVLYEFVAPPAEGVIVDEVEAASAATTAGSIALTPVQIGYFLMNICGSMSIVFLGAAFFSSHLEHEFGRSEDLLQNILPRSIAKRLKEGECHIVDNFEGVTILFADLVGFTKASAEMHPNFLVGMFLRDVFSAWDELCQWRGLEKIKTIGDAFMVVGGLAGDDGSQHCGGTHAEEVVLLALEFQDSLVEVNEKYGLDFQVRIGMHSGPVIAGVIGLKKFAFDVWGDAVNTSSRMESHGISGKIHVSGATYNLISHLPYLDFECLGPCEIKGKGLMTTYIVERRGSGQRSRKDGTIRTGLKTGLSRGDVDADANFNSTGIAGVAVSYSSGAPSAAARVDDAGGEEAGALPVLRMV